MLSDRKAAHFAPKHFASLKASLYLAEFKDNLCQMQPQIVFLICHQFCLFCHFQGGWIVLWTLNVHSTVLTVLLLPKQFGWMCLRWLHPVCDPWSHKLNFNLQCLVVYANDKLNL